MYSTTTFVSYILVNVHPLLPVHEFGTVFQFVSMLHLTVEQCYQSLKTHFSLRLQHIVTDAFSALTINIPTLLTYVSL